MLESIRCTALLMLVLVLTGCSPPAAQKDTRAPASAMPPALVETIKVAYTQVDVPRDAPAQTFSRHKVDVRGRVDGYIEKWLFKPGQMVTKGQVLYVLDQRPYLAQLAEAHGKLKEAQADKTFAEQQVSLAEARANLSQAEAVLTKAKADFSRYKELVAQGAVSQQDYDQAVQNVKSAQANEKARLAAVRQAEVSTNTQIDSAQAKLLQQKAALDNAELNVRYSTITAPISGQIGDSNIPVGGLVTANSQTPLTTIVPLDPIFVRFKVSEAQHLWYVREHKGAAPLLDLFLADGSKFAYRGTVSNTLNEIDRRTGTLEIQASFPNPQKLLLPGQFVRVQYILEHLDKALLVPVKAIKQTQNLQSVFVVNQENVVQARTVTLGQRVGENVIIEKGLQPGERVIVEGSLAVRPGAKVHIANENQQTASEKQVLK